jgi:hypothetical protein
MSAGIAMPIDAIGDSRGGYREKEDLILDTRFCARVLRCACGFELGRTRLLTIARVITVARCRRCAFSRSCRECTRTSVSRAQFPRCRSRRTVLLARGLLGEPERLPLRDRSVRDIWRQPSERHGIAGSQGRLVFPEPPQGLGEVIREPEVTTRLAILSAFRPPSCLKE